MTRNASGRPNRVAPDGSAHAVADRGLLWGNRGRLLDRDGTVVRHSQGRNWICCRLEFHGRHRVQWQPNRLTELYFLDEATAFAAGHRPCGECRHADYQRFKAAWRETNPGTGDTATDIDRRLHAERLAAPGQHRTQEHRLDGLSDGAIVEHNGGFWLVRAANVLAWGFDGYHSARPRSELPASVTVLTPPSTIDVLRAGYLSDVHPSATRFD